MRVMLHTVNSELIARAKELLWVIARCDVEDIKGHRSLALAKLRELELLAGKFDFYMQIAAQA